MATFVESEDADGENVDIFFEGKADVDGTFSVNKSAEDLTPTVEGRKADVDETFSVKTWAEDLTLKVEGRKLYVSKVLLASVSPVFRKMFGGEYRKKNEITLHNKKHADVVEFLHCVYHNPKPRRNITKDNVMSIYPLILEFNVELMKEKCESLLSEIVESLDTADELIQHFLKFSEEGLTNLRQQCLSRLVEKDIEVLKQNETFCSLPAEVKIEILIKMAENLTEKVNGKDKTITEQKESIENHQLFRRYFLSFQSKHGARLLEMYSYCRVIEYEFMPNSQKKYISNYISLGDVKVALVISKTDCYGLETDLRFKSENKYAVEARFILVNQFSARENFAEGQGELPKFWRIKWTDMIDESRGFIRDGKVKFIAYILF